MQTVKSFVTEQRCFSVVTLYIDIDLDGAISVMP